MVEVKTEDLMEMFYVSRTTMTQAVKKGIPFREIYGVFISDEIPRAKKRKYLYGLSSIDEDAKDRIWERFMGDRGFDYCKEENYMDITQKGKDLFAEEEE